MRLGVINKTLSFIIGIFSAILIFSSLVSYKPSLEWLIRVSAGYFLDAEIVNIEAESNWHPFAPKIKVVQAELEFGENNPITYLNLSGINLSTDISRFLQIDSFLELKIEKGELRLNPKSRLNKDSSFSLSEYLSYIDITDIKIKDQNQITLRRLSFNQQNQFYIEAIDEDGGSIVISSDKAEILNDKNYLDGYIEINEFNLNSTSSLLGVTLSGKLNAKSWIKLIEGKLIFLEGYFNLNETSLFSNQDKINGLIRLEDGYERPYFSLTDLEINTNNQTFNIPSTFVSINEQGIEINIPKILAGKETLVEKVTNLDFVSFGGSLEDVFIRLEGNGPRLSVNFKDITVIDENRKFVVEGINGFGEFSNDIALLNLDSSKIDISSETFFEDKFSLTDVTGNFSVHFLNDSLKYSSKDLMFRKEGEILRSKISHYISKKVNDLSILINTTENKVNNLKVFFPISPNTNKIRNFINDSLECGKLRNSSLLYRTNLNDSPYSSENIQMTFSLEEGCLSISEYDLKNVTLVGTLNSSKFDAELKSSNFYGSNLKAILEFNPKENNNLLSTSGSFEGPLETYFKIVDPNLEYKSSIKNTTGSQKTTFNLSGGLSDFINDKPNKKDTINYSFYSRITNGSFDMEFPDFKIKKLNSTINFDSKKGITNSFVDLNLNAQALRFKAFSSKENLLFESKATLNSKTIAKSVGLDFINAKGKSNFLIRISVPFKDTKSTIVQVSSNLRGTDFYLISDIKKSKNQEIQFDLNSTIRRNDLSFELNLGELLQGNIRLLQGRTSGIVVLNPKPGNQNKYIERVGKLKITGSLNFLNFEDILDSNLESNTEIPSNVLIEDLYISNASVGNLDLDEVKLNLNNQDDYIYINLDGREIKGDAYLSNNLSDGLILSLDYLIYNSSEKFEGSIWDSFPASLNFPLSFYSKEIVINNDYYGPWSFDVSIDSEIISFENISGSYGQFRIGERISIPDFDPQVNPFDKLNGLTKKKINQSLGQGDWSIPTQTNLRFYRNKRQNFSKLSGIISTPNLSNAIGLEYSEYKVEAGEFFLLADVRWEGGPENIDRNNLKGKVEFRLKDLFIPRESEETSEVDILRLIRVFNIADIFGNLTDLFNRRFEKGFSSDRVEAFLEISPNKLETSKSMVFKSSSGEFKWDGYVLKDKSGKFTKIDFDVVMTLPLRDYLPAYALILGGPLSAVGVYIAGRTFKRPLNKLSSGKWRVWGSLDDIKAEFVEWFE